MIKYPWMAIARQELGVEEVPGPGDEPRIVEYLHATTIGAPENDNDETPWCSAFVSWCLEQVGVRSTKSAWARSYLDWGREPTDDEFGEGVIVILWRTSPHGSSGHVGFLSDWDNNRVKLLAGNQGDTVSEAWFNQGRVLGYRVPKEV